MIRTIRLAALALALAAATPASAQQPRPSAGIGIGLPTADFSGTFFRGDLPVGNVAPQIYIPLNVSPALRIEPQFGFIKTSDDASGAERSYTSVGTGVFWVAQLGSQVDAYVGPRFLISWFHDTTVGGGGAETKSHATDLLIALAVGGEVALHPRLSVGAEGQIAYTSLGDLHVDQAGTSFTTSGGSTWTTQGVLFVRVYLF